MEIPNIFVLYPSSGFGLELSTPFALMASLAGVVEEWDNSEVVRERLREHHLLIIAPPLTSCVRINVNHGEHNFEALKPLAKRLQHEDGHIGMHTIPHLMHQSL